MQTTFGNLTDHFMSGKSFLKGFLLGIIISLALGALFFGYLKSNTRIKAGYSENYKILNEEQVYNKR